MTDYFPFMLAVIVALLGAFILLFSQGKIKPLEANYQAFLLLGLAWLVIGLANDNFGLGGLGAIFFILGLSGRYRAAQ